MEALSSEELSKALYRAVLEGDAGSVQSLIRAGAGAGASVHHSNVFRETALHVAAIADNNSQVIQLLVAAGASLTAGDNNGPQASKLGTATTEKQAGDGTAVQELLQLLGIG
ncbi:hypothetical protein ABPG75_002446 [Micractinium tetrahymenae]